jgi:ubiquinone/menaquinone biosynthesis C-methylase UbiE/uncharacterized protein YbaR (Trm112 family)
MNQSIENKKGEILFRKKLVEQHIEGKRHFANEFDKDKIESILRQRMEKTLADIQAIRSLGGILAPCLEIGAERGQRSLVVANDLELESVATDISFDMLRTTEYYSKIFSKPKMPVRICCDIYNLPFLSNSIPFAFCYETLHHFPTIEPVLKEIHRVVSPNGLFFFDEEPYKPILHINLYRGTKGNFKKRSFIKKLLDYFFSRKVTTEEEFGIIENENIPLKLWKHSIAIFDQNKIQLRSMKFIKAEIQGFPLAPSRIAASLLGGNISGLCRKISSDTYHPRSIFNLLSCPECKEVACREIQIIQISAVSFGCSRCGTVFPIHDGVLFLFSRNKMSELYQELIRFQV